MHSVRSTALSQPEAAAPKLCGLNYSSVWWANSKLHSMYISCMCVIMNWIVFPQNLRIESLNVDVTIFKETF